jgi:hypothetical protein
MTFFVALGVRQVVTYGFNKKLCGGIECIGAGPSFPYRIPLVNYVNTPATGVL